MTQLRKVNLLDSDDAVIDPTEKGIQEFQRSLTQEGLIKLDIIIKHLEIITDNVITEQDLQ